MTAKFERVAWFCFWSTALLSTAWRPFTLGFLTDDWTVLVDPLTTSPAFSAERWRALEIAQNRPALQLVLFSLTSLIPAETFAWHAVGAAINVAVGLAIAFFARDILSASLGRGEAAGVGGLFAGACWIAFPFSAATQFWATGTTSIVSVGLFAISCSFLLRGWQGSRRTLFFGAAISFVGYLVYEASFFQIALVFLFAALRFGWRSDNVRFAAISYGGAQILAIVFGRVMRMLGADGSRKINANFVDTYFHWYLYIGRFLGVDRWTVYAVLAIAALALGGGLWAISRRMGRPLRLWFCLVFGGLLVAASAVLATLPLSMPEGIAPIVAGLGVLCVVALRARTLPPNAALLAVLVLSGICLGALPFAIGNYVVFSLGFGARATLGMSLWLALGLGALASVAWRARPQAVAAGLLLIWGGLAVSDFMRGREWSQAGALLATVFIDPPPFPFGQPAADAKFLLMAPELPGRVPVIEVNHHVYAIARYAFWPQAPDADRKAEILGWDGRWVVARDLVWNTKWDGNTITQYECRYGEVFTRTAASSVWVWNQSARTILPLAAPYESGCRHATEAAKLAD